jgi:hypothetical protein
MSVPDTYLMQRCVRCGDVQGPFYSHRDSEAVMVMHLAAAHGYVGKIIRPANAEAEIRAEIAAEREARS